MNRPQPQPSGYYPHPCSFPFRNFDHTDDQPQPMAPTDPSTLPDLIVVSPKLLPGENFSTDEILTNGFNLDAHYVAKRDGRSWLTRNDKGDERVIALDVPSAHLTSPSGCRAGSHRLAGHFVRIAGNVRPGAPIGPLGPLVPNIPPLKLAPDTDALELASVAEALDPDTVGSMPRGNGLHRELETYRTELVEERAAHSATRDELAKESEQHEACARNLSELLDRLGIEDGTDEEARVSALLNAEQDLAALRDDLVSGAPSPEEEADDLVMAQRALDDARAEIDSMRKANAARAFRGPTEREQLIRMLADARSMLQNQAQLAQQHDASLAHRAARFLALPEDRE